MKYLDLTEFRDLGYLQEVNRLFFHPLGLALEVYTDTDTGDVTHLGGIWDYRGDPEGVLFVPVGGGDDLCSWADDGTAETKRLTVRAEFRRHESSRRRLLSGRVTQPTKRIEKEALG